ncbi:hypothetical protein RJT34_16194 [Clitoria ternatea]|uniref:HD domain-containing protein n=1 Tax=Clitoria ternatea TaxID=43366 RepID=A0AAN9PCP0_CLITE
MSDSIAKSFEQTRENIFLLKWYGYVSHLPVSVSVTFFDQGDPVQPPSLGVELGIDRFDIQAVKFARLMHDVGHGPFSHLFERKFVDEVEMILASSECALPKSSSEKRFLYDMVVNGRNGIDVDKFDYITRGCRAVGLGCNFEFQRLLETMRILDDQICYRAKDC